MGNISGTSSVSSNMLRITGMATGMDTDNTVKQMMKPYNMQLDKIKQARQILLWKQELYRSTLDDLSTFQKTYFDVLKPDNYMLSANNFTTFDSTYPNVSDSTTATATAGAGAMNGTYTLTNIQIAKKAAVTAAANPLALKQANDIPNLTTTIDGTNNLFKINEKGITIDSSTYNTTLDLVNNINSKIAADVDLSGKVTARVALDGTSVSYYSIKQIDDSNKTQTVTFGGNSYTITIDNGSYAMPDLADKINTALKSAKDSGGNTIDLTSQIVAKAGSDGNSISYASPIGAAVSGPSFNDGSLKLDASANSKAPTITSNTAIKYDMTVKIQAGVNDTLTFSIDGVNKGSITITPKNNYSLSDLKKEINDKIALNADLNGFIQADLSADGSKFVFKNAAGKEANQVNITGNSLQSLGFSSSIVEVHPSSYDKVSSLFSTDADARNISFTINGKAFSYDFSSTGANYNMTIKDFVNDVSSKAGVNFSYSELARKFKLESQSTGSSQSISLSWTNDAGNTNSSSFLGKLFGGIGATAAGAAGSITPVVGSDAKVHIKDPSGNESDIVKQNNSFSIDGVSYNLLKGDSVTPGTATIVITQNTQKAIDKIKDYVNKYNDIIGKINTKITEKKNRDYAPLTDEQKEAMSDDQIKTWEDKAKQGLLRNDSDLQSMLYDLRNAIYTPVEGVGLSLYDIGIDTSADYLSGGKLTIDESKLKEALASKGEQVSKLFTQVSSSQSLYSSSLTHEQRTTRYNEEGVFQRVNDILKDYTRTMDGKGSLIQKAGIKGDSSEIKNLLSDQMKEKDTSIKEMLSKIKDKENRYYQMFARLEQAMNQMNAQQSWLAQQLGSK